MLLLLKSLSSLCLQGSVFAQKSQFWFKSPRFDSKVSVLVQKSQFLFQKSQFLLRNSQFFLRILLRSSHLVPQIFLLRSLAFQNQSNQNFSIFFHKQIQTPKNHDPVTKKSRKNFKNSTKMAEKSEDPNSKSPPKIVPIVMTPPSEESADKSADESLDLNNVEVIDDLNINRWLMRIMRLGKEEKVSIFEFPALFQVKFGLCMDRKLSRSGLGSLFTFSAQCSGVLAQFEIRR